MGAATSLVAVELKLVGVSFGSATLTEVSSLFLGVDSIVGGRVVAKLGVVMVATWSLVSARESEPIKLGLTVVVVVIIVVVVTN